MNLADICAWLASVDIYNYQVDEDGKVNVFSSVVLSNLKLTHIPVQFGVVYGNFDVSHNRLKSLDGCPSEIWGDFLGDWNQLNTLVGGPKHVAGYYSVSHNKLTSLDGCAQLPHSLDCSFNQLMDLVGGPLLVISDYVCSNNFLTTLEGVAHTVPGTLNFSNNMVVSLTGSPEVVGWDFNGQGNRLANLLGGPRRVNGTYNVAYNLLTRLTGAPRRVGGFNCSNNQNLGSLMGGPLVTDHGNYDASSCRIKDLVGGPVWIAGAFLLFDNLLVTLDDEVRCIREYVDVSGNKDLRSVECPYWVVMDCIHHPSMEIIERNWALHSKSLLLAGLDLSTDSSPGKRERLI